MYSNELEFPQKSIKTVSANKAKLTVDEVQQAGEIVMVACAHTHTHMRHTLRIKLLLYITLMSCIMTNILNGGGHLFPCTDMFICLKLFFQIWSNLILSLTLYFRV